MNQLTRKLHLSLAAVFAGLASAATVASAATPMPRATQAGQDACAVAPLSGNAVGVLAKPGLSANGFRVGFSSTGDPVGRNYDSSIEVFLVSDNLGSSTSLQISESPGSILGGFNLAPSLSADGTRMSFFSDRNLKGANGDGNFEVFVASIDAGNAVTLHQITTSTIGANTFPNLRADGNAVVFASDRNYTGQNTQGANQIYVANLNATGALSGYVQVTQLPAGQSADSPTQDDAGARVLYIANDASSFGTQTDVYLAVLSGTAYSYHRVTNNGGTVSFFDAAISADGNSAVFVRQNTDQTSDVILADLSDLNNIVTQTVSGPFGNANIRPSISADGTRVVYAAQVISAGQVISTQLILNDLSGSSHNAIVEIDSDTVPNMNSAGTKVVFARGNLVYIATCGISDLAIRATANLPPPPVFAGRVITQSYVITNNGPTEAGSVSFFWTGGPGLTSTLDGVPVAVLTTTTGTCDVALMRCDLGQVYPDQTVPLTVVMGIEPTRRNPVTSTARVEAIAIDRVSSNNVATLTKSINGPANIVIAFAETGANAVAGARYTATVIVTNTGPADSTGSNIAFTPPDDAILAPEAITGCSRTGNVANCSFGVLTINQTATVRIPVILDAASRGPIGGVAVSNGTFDDPAGDSAQLNLIAVGSADMRASKTAIFAGPTVSFTLSITNTGPSVANSIVFTDTLPSEVGVKSADLTDDDGTSTGFGGGTRSQMRVVNGQLTLDQGLHLPGGTTSQPWIGMSNASAHLEMEFDSNGASDALGITNYASTGAFACAGNVSQCPNFVNGVVGNGLLFDNQDVLGGPPFAYGANDFTFMTWVKPDASVSGQQALFSNRFPQYPGCFPPFVFPLNPLLWGGLEVGIAPAGDGYALYFNPTLNFSCQTTSTPLNSVPAGRWTHVAVVMRNAMPGEGFKMYINGELAAESVNDNPATFLYNGIAPYQAVVGRNAFVGGINQYRGAMDELATFERALSDADIRLIYQTQAFQNGSFTSRVMDASDTNPWDGLLSFGQRPMGKQLPDDGSADPAGIYAEGALNMGALANRGLWHFEEGGTNQPIDSSGSSIVMNCGGGCPDSVDGRFGKARVFNSNRILVPRNSPNRLHQDFSIAFWMRTNDANTVSGTPQWFNGKPIIDAESGDRTWAIGFANGRAMFGTTAGVTPQTMYSNKRLADGQWHHVLATRRSSSGEVALYVDGQLAQRGSGAVGDLASSLPGNIAIGADRVDPNFWNGELDEVALFETTLSATHARDLYARGITKTRFQVKACADNSCATPADFVGPDGTVNTYYDSPATVTNTVPLLSLPSTRFFRYRMEMTNEQPQFTYHAVERVKVLPDGFPFAASPGVDCSPVATTILCSAPNLAVGQRVTATFGTLVLDPTSKVVNNVVSVSAAEPDPLGANNVYTEPFGINATNLRVALLRAPAGTLTGGTDVTVTLRVTNTHPIASAANTIFTTSFGSGLSNVVVQPEYILKVPDPPLSPYFEVNPQPCTVGTGVITCTLGTHTPGEIKVISYTAKISTNAVGTVPLVMRASTTNVEETLADNTASASFSVTRIVNLAVSHTSPPFALPGQSFAYTVRITNTGPSDATTLTLGDVVPAGFTVTSFPTTYGSCSRPGADVLCDFANLDVGQTLTFTLNGTVGASQRGSITNTVVITGANVPAQIINTRAVPIHVNPTNINIATPGTSPAVGKSFTLTANLLPADATMPITYTWFLPGTDAASQTTLASSLSTSASAKWLSSGTQRVYVTATSSSGASVSDNIDLDVRVDPTSVEISHVGGFTVTSGTNHSFVATVLPANVTFGGGGLRMEFDWLAPGSTTPDPAPVLVNGRTDSQGFRWNSTGTYNVTIQVTSGFGVVVTDTVTVIVQ